MVRKWRASGRRRAAKKSSTKITLRNGGGIMRGGACWSHSNSLNKVNYRSSFLFLFFVTIARFVNISFRRIMLPVGGGGFFVVFSLRFRFVI